MTLHDSRAQVEIGDDAQAPPAADERQHTTFRVLILGDFGGDATRQPLAQRKIHRIDRDGIDAAIAAITPTLAFSIDADAAPERIAFSELDDFHPDYLLTRVAMLARLRELRSTIESRPGAVAGHPAKESAEPDTRSLLDRILETEPPLPAGAPLPPTSTGDDLSDFVRRAVRPHIAREVDPQQRALVSQVDDVLAATLRVLLHDPAFQSLESLWRATDFFLRRCDAGDSTTIGLLDLPRSELTDVFANDAVALRQRLSADADDGQWSLVIAAYSFTQSDVALLTEIAATAEAMGAPWVGSAHPHFVGAHTFADNGDADDWDGAIAPGWYDLRHMPTAPYLGLALPRFLVRLPYGAENPVESLTFEEMLPGVQPHESFLWGNGAFLCALVASTPVERGAPAPSHGAIGGQPLHLGSREGAAQALPCAEALMSQRTVMHVLSRGLTPLAGERDGDVVRIPRLQSIADPPTALPIRPAVRE